VNNTIISLFGQTISITFEQSLRERVDFHSSPSSLGRMVAKATVNNGREWFVMYATLVTYLAIEAWREKGDQEIIGTTRGHQMCNA